jgi:general secretion pathway protein D
MRGEAMIKSLISRKNWIALVMLSIVFSSHSSRGEEGEAPPPPPPPPPIETMEQPPEPPPLDNETIPEPPSLPEDEGGGASAQQPNLPSPSSGKATGLTGGKQKGKGSDSIEAGRELVNMDFPELTDIKDIVKAVSLWTGKNVILDRNVSGKVQIISPKQVTKEEAYQAFLSALNVLSLTTVETGKIIKILPVRTALKGNLKTYVGANWTPPTDEVITQIVPLKYIDSKKIQTTLSRIVTSNTIIAYEPTNTLIISDSGFKVRRILDIIQMLDVQSQQPQVALVPIRHSDAKSVADKVNQILGGSDRSGAGGYKILTDDRSNSVVIFGPPGTINDVKNLVQKFDFAVDDASRQAAIHVRPLDYADAKKLASTLSALATGSGGSSSGARAIPTFTPGGGLSNTPTLRSNSDSNAPPSVADLGSGVKITSDDSSNSLLITGSRGAYDALNTIIRKLDVKKSQVFIESDILDLGMGNDFNFGTSIFSGAGRSDGKGTKQIYGWEAAKMAPLILGSATDPNTKGSTQSGVTAKDMAGSFADELSIGILSGQSITVGGLGTFTPGGLIKMLKTDSNTKILSSPHILISNNEEGTFSAGERYFFKTVETASTVAGGIPSSKVEHEDVALSLNIKPNISYSDFVTMKIDLTADAVSNTDSATGLPIISKRKTTQNVTIKNGQTVVISGLVQSRDIQVFKKIPLLGDIPVIGWLFRNSMIKSQKSNLVIFITPHIVHGPEDLAAIYKAKVNERDQMLEDMYGWNYDSDDFYKRLPSKQAGAYVPTELDAAESKASAERRQQTLENMGYLNPQRDQRRAEAEAGKVDSYPLPVPVRAGSPGAGGTGNAGGEFSSPNPGSLPPQSPPPVSNDAQDPQAPQPPVE